MSHLPYTVVGTQDVSVMRRGERYNRLALRIVIDGADMAFQGQIDDTLRHAAESARMGRFKMTKPAAVMVFGYRPGDDTEQAYTLGRYTHGTWSD